MRERERERERERSMARVVTRMRRMTPTRFATFVALCCFLVLCCLTLVPVRGAQVEESAGDTGGAGSTNGSSLKDIEAEEGDDPIKVFEGVGDEKLVDSGIQIGDRIDDVYGNFEDNSDNYTYYKNSSQMFIKDLSDEKLDEALQRFEQDAKSGLIPQDALSENLLDFNQSVLIYQPPLSQLNYEEGGRLTDPGTSIILTLYEILDDPEGYSIDELLDQFAYIVGMPQFNSAFQLELVKTGLPSLSDTVVRTWQTNFIVDVFQDIKVKLKENLSEVTDKLSKVTDKSLPLEERQKEGIDLIVDLGVEMVRDSDGQIWQDITAILGQPLGPALIPTLNSSIVQGMLDDTEGIKERAMERREEVLDALRTVAAKVILFDDFFPAPCLRDDSYCPSDFQNNSKGVQLQGLYREAAGVSSKNDLSALDFYDDFKEDFLKLFMGEMGLSDMLKLMEEALKSPETFKILSYLSQSGDINNAEVNFLHNFSLGNITLAVDPAIADARVNTMICLANVSSLMYEAPNVKTSWSQGLGLEEGGDYEVAGSFSAISKTFVDPKANAIVLAFEGTPYIQSNFFRGLYGWLQDLLSALKVPFGYNCASVFMGQDARQQCTRLANKYPDAQVYRGFLPTEKDGDLISAVEDALEALKEQQAGDSVEKPKLYITGHSLGGALAKNALIQLLLKGYRDKFSAVTAYTFAPPVTGNDDYISMAQELLNTTGTDIFMIMNQYDFVPYLPPFQNFTHGEQTLFFDHDQALLKEINTLNYPYENQPRNVYMPPLGYHSIKAGYLPLARALVGSRFINGTGKSTVSTDCQISCDTGQCGAFKCADSCAGYL